MPRARRDLGEYVKRVMKLKGLTQKDVQRVSGGRITDGYVASISIGRARNPSVDKLKALADGLGVDMDELFHVACGLPEDGRSGEEQSSAGPPDDFGYCPKGFGQSRYDPDPSRSGHPDA